MRNTRIAGVAAAIAATMMCGIAFASPASANIAPPKDGTWDHIWYASDDSYMLMSEENGDIIELCDTKADNKSVDVHVEWGGDVDNFGAFDMRIGGVGTCAWSDYTTHDIPEGYEVYLYLFTGEKLMDQTWFINDH